MFDDLFRWVEDPAAAIRRNNYQLPNMVSSMFATVEDVNALIKYLEHDELIELIQQGLLLTLCIRGSRRTLAVGDQ
eukprot:jgi/Chrzof1/11194/Cz05g27180.t1